jgi:hypothetical protein
VQGPESVRAVGPHLRLDGHEGPVLQAYVHAEGPWSIDVDLEIHEQDPGAGLTVGSQVRWTREMLVCGAARRPVAARRRAALRVSWVARRLRCQVDDAVLVVDAGSRPSVDVGIVGGRLLATVTRMTARGLEVSRQGRGPYERVLVGELEATTRATTDDDPLVRHAALTALGMPSNPVDLTAAQRRVLLRAGADVAHTPEQWLQAWRAPLDAGDPWAIRALLSRPAGTHEPLERLRIAALIEHGELAAAEAALSAWEAPELAARLALARGDQDGARRLLLGWVGEDPAKRDRVYDDPAFRALGPWPWPETPTVLLD